MARLYLSGQNEITDHLLKIFFYEKKSQNILTKNIHLNYHIHTSINLLTMQLTG